MFFLNFVFVYGFRGGLADLCFFGWYGVIGEVRMFFWFSVSFDFVFRFLGFERRLGSSRSRFMVSFVGFSYYFTFLVKIRDVGEAGLGCIL